MPYYYNTHNYIFIYCASFVVQHLSCLLTAVYQTLNIDLWFVWISLGFGCDVDCNHSSLTNLVKSHADILRFLGQFYEETFLVFH